MFKFCSFVPLFIFCCRWNSNVCYFVFVRENMMIEKYIARMFVLCLVSRSWEKFVLQARFRGDYLCLVGFCWQDRDLLYYFVCFYCWPRIYFMFCLNKYIFLVIYIRVFNSRPRMWEVNQNLCERFTSLSLNCHGSDCNIDYSLCLCCFLRAPCERLSLLSCLSLSGEKCFAPLRLLVEQFAPHSTHVDDSDLNLSACII